MPKKEEMNKEFINSIITEDPSKTVRYDGYNIEENEGLAVLIDTPLILSSKGIRLEATSSHFMISIRPIYNLCLQFPASIQSDLTMAGFSSKTRQIILIAALVPSTNTDKVERAVDSSALNSDYLFDVV